MGNSSKSTGDNERNVSNRKCDPSLLLAWLLIILAFFDLVFILSQKKQG